MGFKSIIVSLVIRPDQDYHRRELWHLKQEIKEAFKKYGSTSCSYLLRKPESSFYGYEDNFAIVDFKKKKGATSALRAVENGEISINKITITAKPIDMTHCPMDKLPDNCLLAIFQHLSTYEQLKLSAVCKRWGEVSQPLWRNVTKIDLRDKSLVNKNKKYIINSGSRLKDIYCYDDHGLKIIGKHCKNLESIALEFRKYTKRKELDKACIQYERQTLQQFMNLTRLLLKIRTPQYTYFSFLQHLPLTMIEIHLVNDIQEKSTPKDRYWDAKCAEEARFKDSQEKYGRKTLDLSRFSNLRALTLKCYHLDGDSLIGLEKLKKLICLCLDRSYLSKLFLDKLKFFTNLEHLSLKRISMNYEDSWLLLKRNKNLKYLALPQMKDSSFDESIWHRSLELEHLKVICWNEADHKIREHGISTTVEYVEHHNVGLSDRRTLLFLENFPNLKAFKRTGYWGSNSDWFISDVKRIIVDRVHKAPMRYYHEPRKSYPGRQYTPIENHNSDNFEHSDVVSDEDARIFRCNEWDGWYIEDLSEPTQSTTTSSSIIEELSDTCLNKIFDYLPLDDRLTAAEVCKRWDNVLGENWEKCKRFDMRELSCHENREKCMIQCGKYFDDIYAYKSCGFSGIETHCRNVQSLALDFGVKRCRCRPSSRKERYSLRSLQPTLMRLKHLSRIMLRDAPVFQSDIFQHLPECLEEIHVFNRCPMSSDKPTESQVKDNAIMLDLSRYSKLRALTLIEAQIIQQVPSKKIARVIGLENLERLIYLRASGVIIAEDSGDPLKNIKKLEYLSLPLSTLSANNFGSMIENNRNIEYLDITDNFDGVPISKFLPILTLQRLKYLRMINIIATNPDGEVFEGFQEIPTEFEFTNDMPHLEILDCEGPRALPQDLFLQLIGGSPNLKMVNVSVIDTSIAEEFLAVAESNIMARFGRNSDIRAFVGMEGFRLCSNLRLHVDGVILCNVPPQKYCTIVERSYWNGWSTQNGRRNVSILCAQLINSIDH